jgi:CheY-like chemotaxis protein
VGDAAFHSSEGAAQVSENDTHGTETRTILVVEDEAVTALNLKKMLEKAGYRVIGPAATVKAAHAFMAENRVDAALMDVNLGGDTRVFPLAEVLAALRVPFAFVSGHPRGLMPPNLHDRPFVAKPYGEAEIMELAKQLLA